MFSNLWDGFMFLVIVVVAQILIAGIQSVLDDNGVDFPPSILAMAGVFLVFSVAGSILPGVEDFYQKWLRSSANLLNRHMSIGFTIPFVMICRSPFADGQTIGLIIACFLLTGILNTITSYALSLPLWCLMIRWDKRFWGCGPTQTEVIEGRRAGELRMPIKSLSSSVDVGIYGASEGASPDDSQIALSVEKSPSPAPGCPSSPCGQFFGWIFQKPMLLLSWLLTILIGLPLRYTAGNDSVFSTFLLFAIWLSTLTIQARIKASQLRPWLRTFLSGMSNAVLWTSLAMIAYVFAEGAISGRSLHVMLDTLQTNTTLSTFILQAAKSGSLTGSGSPITQQPIAAGDIALSLLNAGLVSWGLKLYECRQQLLSRAGLTVFTVSSLLALGNVVCWPLLAHAMGLGLAGRTLAFAARSVTLALGNPVMAVLGGDTGLNATMVVISGIMFQMGLGFGVGAWMEKKVHQLMNGKARGDVVKSRFFASSIGSRQEHCAMPAAGLHGGVLITTTTITTTSPAHGHGHDHDIEAQNHSYNNINIENHPAVDASRPAGNGSGTDDEPCTVAAGVTIGINAAAMGTAYLYEAKSDAAPYAALSMIALGIMTVVFSSIQPLAHFVMASVAA
ncbi:hypothetical protein B0H63DRAFT_529093 [Podospora didyma]|uniref:LrgB-like protein n=1 Tax=Podospora didyma TaxID=330526 RepID=A0AAE0N2W0_9PEZI|nr:hypothetical protein B0H63DRAFT_529093 [Podospora didyma]